MLSHLTTFCPPQQLLISTNIWEHWDSYSTTYQCGYIGMTFIQVKRQLFQNWHYLPELQITSKAQTIWLTSDTKMNNSIAFLDKFQVNGYTSIKQNDISLIQFLRLGHESDYFSVQTPVNHHHPINWIINKQFRQ